MSSNNYIRIKPVAIEDRPPVGVAGIRYIVEHCDADTGPYGVIGKSENLEAAIKFANKFMDENMVEYGLQVTV